MNLNDAITGLKNAFLQKGRDGFPLNPSAPDYRWQKLFHELLVGLPRISFNQQIKYAEQPSVRVILESPPADQVAALQALVNRRTANDHAFMKAGSRGAEESDCDYILHKLTVFLLRRIRPSSSSQVALVVFAYEKSPNFRFRQNDAPALLAMCEKFVSEGTMCPDLHRAINGFATALNPTNQAYGSWEGAADRRTREGFEKLLSTSSVPSTDAAVPVARSRTPAKMDDRDPWAANISTYVAGLHDDKGFAWDKLIAHARTASQTRPSGKWLKEADRILNDVGRDEFKARVLEWFPTVCPSVKANKMTFFTREPMLPANADVLRGLVWFCSCFEDEALTRAVSDLGQAVYKKLPGWGPLSAKVGNACLFTLSQLPGLGPISQLSRLRLRVKYSTALRLIDGALEAAAKNLGMTSDELEEIAVPTYGLDANGCLLEEFGDFTAEVKVIGTHETELTWIKSDGKVQKSIPAHIKEEHAEELKELKRSIQDIEKMLPCQRDRIERSFLANREWTFEKWAELYLNHPLVSQIARRLIWSFHNGERIVAGIWKEGKIVGLDDLPIDTLSSETRVRLWHPLGVDVATVSAWRRWIEDHQVAQPFKQAHREIYVLTDAEERTSVYSNRFAAHIIKQHQFAALARQRGWTYTLQGQFDSHNTPTLCLPRWNLIVEFWVDPATGSGAASDMGIFLYLSTDQVRYNDPTRTPRVLTEVPALVFSEVMRDVDLFVGVCSIGNDPAWQDSGDRQQYGAYWRDMSFGDLSTSAQTLREVLERLLPRLKIASQCTLENKFLVVRGALRTYKIHLGSGNILMEPNDQYLCIVPDRSAAVRSENVFLPFEGDNTLSVVLSKAFLLANDTRIKDASIMSQITRQ